MDRILPIVCQNPSPGFYYSPALGVWIFFTITAHVVIDSISGIGTMVICANLN